MFSLVTLISWLLQHCSPSTFQVNLSGLQPSSTEIWVLQPTTLQYQPSKVSFLGIFRATIPPHNFLAATFLLFVIKLFEAKRKKLWRFESLMFPVETLNSRNMHYVLNMPSNFTFHVSLNVLYDNWLLLKLLTRF